MGLMNGYPSDTAISDDDNFFGPDNTGATKKYPAVLVKKYVGDGITPTTDTWSFSSYNSTTKVGVINATAGANTRYAIGQWIRFAQPTLGIKWAKITGLSSSTITAKFISTYQLDNEVISNPNYSASYSPLGSPNDGVIQANELSASAITLGYEQITSNFSTSSTSVVQVTGLTATVIIPAGGRRVRITAFGLNADNTTTARNTIAIFDGAVGSGTQVGASQISVSAGFAGPFFAQAIVTPSAGTKTYNIGMAVSGGTAVLTASALAPAFILVEAI